MRNAILAGLSAGLLSAAMALAAPMTGKETYDLLFRDGTLDGIDREGALVYRREVKNRLNPNAEGRDTGDIALSFRQDQKAMAKLEFRKGDKHRALGVFPASVGNPMIMYFYESVVRDMAESAGGSPFYIRNRVKESLIQPSEVETGEAMVDGKPVETYTVRLHPFSDDPNKDRMKGFGDLELSVTMSDAVPGWYLSLVATAAATEGTPVYLSKVHFERLEQGQ